MEKNKIVKTKQGNLDVWEHESAAGKAAAEQMYASRIFDKEKRIHIFKLHSSVNALQSYINNLNLV